MRTLGLALLALVSISACSPPAANAPLTGQALLDRGDYLVNGVVLCGDCHTPRLQDMSSDLTRRLQGADIGESGPPEIFATYAPALAGLPANYSEEQFISFLQTGARPDGSHPRPPMPGYRLNEEDARAVSAYIASLPRAPE